MVGAVVFHPVLGMGLAVWVYSIAELEAGEQVSKAASLLELASLIAVHLGTDDPALVAVDGPMAAHLDTAAPVMLAMADSHLAVLLESLLVESGAPSGGLAVDSGDLDVVDPVGSQLAALDLSVLPGSVQLH